MKSPQLVLPCDPRWWRSLVLLVVVLSVVLPVSGLSQSRYLEITPAMGFFAPPVSPAGKGMGGSAAILPSMDPAATLDNPAQLAFSSFANTFSAATLTTRSVFESTVPFYYSPGLSFNVTALNVGLNLENILSLPLPVGVGVGYSRFSYDFGRQQAPPPGSVSTVPPSVYGLHPVFRTENFSMGVGVDYWARLGVGLTFKHGTEEGWPYETASTSTVIVASPSAWAQDLGVMLVVPVADIAARVRGGALELPHGFRPQLDLVGGYVLANLGNEVRYPNVSVDAPLPRMARLGVGVEAALRTKVGAADWKLISASIVRQAETDLWHRAVDGTVLPYDGGAGAINFLQNVVGGKYTDKVWVRKGWQLELGEFWTLRGGSSGIGGNDDLQLGTDIQTWGYSLSLGGLVRTLEFASPATRDNAWLAFIGDHLDLVYSHDMPQQQDPVYVQTPYQALNLVVKGLPWQ